MPCIHCQDVGLYLKIYQEPLQDFRQEDTVNNISVLGRILGSSVRAFRLVEDRRLSVSVRATRRFWKDMHLEVGAFQRDGGGKKALRKVRLMVWLRRKTEGCVDELYLK